MSTSDKQKSYPYPETYDELPPTYAANAACPQGQYPLGQHPSQFPTQQHAAHSSEQYSAGYDQPGIPTVIVQQPYIQNSRIYTNQELPPSYLGLAIFSCLCCFWPTGICAIVAASNANSAIAAGDIVGAKKSSNAAKYLSITSIIIGVIAITVYIVLKFVVLREDSHGITYN